MLHHIEINVRNLKNSEVFWGWFLEELGYEPFQKWDKGFSYKEGNTYLVFVQTEERFMDIPYHRGRTGLNHLAFTAKSSKHVDEMTRKLREKGIPILYEDRHPYAGGSEHYAVFFKFLDRIIVELAANL